MASKTPRTSKSGRKEQQRVTPLVQETNKENEENVQQEVQSQSGRQKRRHSTPRKQQPKKAPKKTKEDSPQTQEIDESAETLETATETSSRTKKTRKKTQQKQGKKQSSAEPTFNFFDVVRSTNTAVDPTIEEWKSNYSRDRESATLDVINFVIEASGCKSKISLEQFRNFKPDTDISPLLQTMSKESGLEAEGGEYPVVSKKQQFKKFKPSFLDFWKKLIQSVSKSILYDGYFIPTLLDWLMAISLSEIRPFRHTSTITALAIGRGLSNVAANLASQLATIDRQLKAEKKKKESASSTKVKDLEKKSHQLNGQIKTIEKYLEKIFEEIFAHRYRDIFPEIRSLCISFLGDWIHEYPKFFYTNAHLRYIGWCLSDKAPEVRLTAIKVLEALILKDNLLQQQQSFVQYFKNRMIQMIEDKDVSVVVNAIKLASYLKNAELLNEDEIAKVYSMISDENAHVRVAAASFIYEHIFEPLIKAKESSQTQMRALLDFIEERTQHPDLPHYIIDALWDKLSFLHEWETFTDLLLIDKESKKLSESQQLLLIRILNCCVKKACGDRIVPDQKETKKTTEKEIQQALTQHLVKYVPELLSRFKTDPEKVIELVEIPRYFLLDVYYHLRLQNYFSDLLKLLKEVFVKQVNDQVFKETAKTIAFLLQEHPLRRDADVMVQELTEEIHKKLKSQIATVIQKRKSKTSKENEQFALAVSLKRLTALSSHIELSRFSDLYSTVDEILAARQKDEDIHEEAVSNAISFVFYHILWLRNRIDLQSPQQELVNELIDKRNKFFVQLEKFLTDPSDMIREKAYLVSNDLFIVFSRSMREAKTTLAHLSYDPPVSFVQKIKQHFLNVCNKIIDENDDEELLKQEKIISALAKSIIWGAFPIDHSPIILEQFVSHGKYIEELIRAFLTKLRTKAGSDEWRYILETLKAKFQKSLEQISASEVEKVTPSSSKKKNKEEAKDEEQGEHKGDETEEEDESVSQFQDFVRLAKRLANSYGVSSGRPETLRRSLATLVVQCAKYGLEEFPRHVDFLRGAIHFVVKLDPQSVLTVNEKWRILISQFGQKVNETDPKLKPFFDFKNKLETLAKGDKGAKKTPASTPTPSTRKKTVKKRLDFTSVSKSKESDVGEDEEDREEVQEAKHPVSNQKDKKSQTKGEETVTVEPTKDKEQQQTKKRKRESRVISLYDEEEDQDSKTKEDDVLHEDVLATTTEKRSSTKEDTNRTRLTEEGGDTEKKEARQKKRAKTTKK